MFSDHYFTIPSINRLAFGSGRLKVDGSPDSDADTLSHSLTLVQRLEALLLLGNGSDVTLRVETPNADEVKLMAVHALVLSLQSPVLEDLLRERNGSGVLTLRESPECASVFEKFVRSGLLGALRRMRTHKQNDHL